MLEFLRILQNEWIKLVRRRRFFIVLLLGIIMLAAFVLVIDRNQQSHKQADSLENQVLMLQNSIQATERELQNGNVPAAQKEGMKQGLQSLKNQLANLEQRKSIEPVYDPQKLQQQIDQTKQTLQHLTPDNQWQAGSLELNIRLLEYKLAYHVPSPPDNLPYFETSGWQAIRDFYQIGPSLFVPLLSVLLVADMVSGEQTGGTIKLLLIRPASRSKILLAKYTAALLANLLVGVVLFALLLGSTLLLLGTAGGSDPVAVGVQSTVQTFYTAEGAQMQTVLNLSHASIVSLQAFDLSSLGLTLLASIAMCTLGFFCSVLVRSAAVSTGLSMGVVILGVILQNLGQSSVWTKYFITSDFNLPTAWMGQSGPAAASLLQALLILLVWTFGMYLTGHFLFKRRDILN